MHTTQSQIATVKYHVASYEGTVKVLCNSESDEEEIIAKAKRQIARLSPPFGSQSYEIVERRYI